MIGKLALAIVLVQSTVAFTTVARGTTSAIDAERTAVVRTAAEWDALWTLHAPGRPLPAVNFSRDMVVGVFLGTRPSAGFSVDISAVRATGNTSVVEFRERTPSPDLMVAQALTSPFHLVRVPTRAGTVEFKKITVP